MKAVNNIFILFFFTVSIYSCSTQKKQGIVSRDIIGSWEGCDGRVVNFAFEDDKIVGRYIALGRLKDFGFAQSEVGYEIKSNGNGTYLGKVKWREVNNDIITWRAVQISILGNEYKDEGSDRCGREMTRIKEK